MPSQLLGPVEVGNSLKHFVFNLQSATELISARRANGRTRGGGGGGEEISVTSVEPHRHTQYVQRPVTSCVTRFYAPPLALYVGCPSDLLGKHGGLNET